MNLPFCDDCKKPLGESTRAIIVNDIVFAETGQRPRGFRDLHFCDQKCLTSWVVKTHNKPTILTTDGQVQV